MKRPKVGRPVGWRKPEAERKTEITMVRSTKAEAIRFDKLAKFWGTSRSEAIRRAVRLGYDVAMVRS